MGSVVGIDFILLKIQIKISYLRGVWWAEEQGFEPWEDFHPRRFSRPVHSTTLPLLRQQRVNRQELIQQGV